MKTKKLSILFAAIVLIAAQLACAVGEPTLSNVRLSRDEEGAQPATIFGPSDTIHVVGDVSSLTVGNQIVTRWYVENVPGIEPNYFIDEIVFDATDDPYTYVTFSLSPSADGWPVGTYNVEVYFNGVLTTTLNYSVQ